MCLMLMLLGYLMRISASHASCHIYVQDTSLPEVSREPRGKVSIGDLIQLHACTAHRSPLLLMGTFSAETLCLATIMN